MRFCSFAAALFLAACTSPIVQTTSNDGSPGTPYAIPYGLVPVQVFADSEGIGVTIESATLAADSKVGVLVAKLNSSAFNREDVKVEVDAATGFLTAVTTDSDAKLPLVVDELSQTAGRLVLQSGKAAVLENRVTLFEGTFDPLSSDDVKRINTELCNAVIPASSLFVAENEDAVAADGDVTGLSECSDSNQKLVRLSIAGNDASNSNESESGPNISTCAAGICVRAMTSRIVRVESNGRQLGEKVVNVPAREVIAVPLNRSALADRNTTLTLENGILTSFHDIKESEVLALAKIPGQIIAGLIKGLTDQLGAEKDIVDARKTLVESETNLVRAQSEFNEESLKLQSGSSNDAPAIAAYRSDTLTVHVISAPFTRALEERARSRENTEPNVSFQESEAVGDIVQ